MGVHRWALIVVLFFAVTACDALVQVIDAPPPLPVSEPAPESDAPLLTYSIEVETGIDPSIVTLAGFRSEVAAILKDQRGWTGKGIARFEEVSSGADVHILLARPATVDRNCLPLRTGGRLSCRNGRRLNLNLDRWTSAVAHWTAPLDLYRAYLINHEMGHYLGFGHVSCPGRGQPAPVMMQQTKSLGACVANGWP